MKQARFPDIKTLDAFNWSHDGANAVALGSLATQEVLGTHDFHEFLQWDSNFGTDYQRLEIQFGTPADTAVSQLRRAAVKGRWAYERLFAQEGGDAAKRTIGYWGSADHADVYHHYDDTQYNRLLHGVTPKDHEIPLQGHHLTSVADAVHHGDPSTVYNPHNISIVTREAHLHSQIHGHNGNFHNPTHYQGDEVDENYHKIIHGQRHDIIYEHTESHELQVSLAAGLITGTIASSVHLWQLKNDPRPWKQKAGVIAGTFALQSVQGSIIGVAALSINDHLSEFVSNHVDTIAEHLGHNFSSDLFGHLIGSDAGIEAAVAIRTVIRSVQVLRHGANLNQVSRMAGEQLLNVGLQQLAFTLLGEVLHAKTSLAVPLIGHIVMGLRVGYSVGKVGKNFYDDKRSQIDCAQRRIDVLYDMAAGALRTV